MRFQLKAGVSAFRLLNGSHAGAFFEHGKVYDSVPKEQAYMFSKIEDPAPAASFGSAAEPAAEPAAEAGAVDAAPELPHDNPHGHPPANGVRRRRAVVAGGNDAP